MSESVRITVEDSSKTAEARRVAHRIAGELGFDESLAEQVATVVTEACSNLVSHAGGGEILLTAADLGQTSSSLELLVLDRRAGAMIPLSHMADFYSVPEKGTALLARWRPDKKIATDSPRSLAVGAVNVSMPGEDACGDSWGAVQTENETVILVADGLGHGPEARMASMDAVQILRSNAGLPPKVLVERVHDALRGSRGAAVAVARIDPQGKLVTFAGIGNISARIHSGPRPTQHLVSANGAAGLQIQGLREFSHPWPENGLLVMHSDGLAASTALDNHSGLATRDPSLIAGVLYRDYNRGRDDATVVIAKAA